MTVGEAVIAKMLGSTAITNVVSSRIHTAKAPVQYRNSSYIWLNRQSDTRDMAFDGPTGIRRAKFSIECVANTVSSAIDLADLVRARLDGSASTSSSPVVAIMLVEDQDDEYVPRNTGEDDGFYVSALSLDCIYYST